VVRRNATTTHWKPTWGNVISGLTNSKHRRRIDHIRVTHTMLTPFSSLSLDCWRWASTSQSWNKTTDVCEMSVWHHSVNVTVHRVLVYTFIVALVISEETHRVADSVQHIRRLWTEGRTDLVGLGFVLKQDSNNRHFEYSANEIFKYIE